MIITDPNRSENIDYWFLQNMISFYKVHEICRWLVWLVLYVCECVQTQVMKKVCTFISFRMISSTGNIVKHSTQSNRLTCVIIHMHEQDLFADRKAKGPKRFCL